MLSSDSRCAYINLQAEEYTSETITVTMGNPTDVYVIEDGQSLIDVQSLLEEDTSDNVAPYFTSFDKSDLSFTIEFSLDELENGFDEQVYEYKTPMIKDGEQDDITVVIDSAWESIPCGCVQVVHDEDSNSINFYIDKALLAEEH